MESVAKRLGNGGRSILVKCLDRSIFPEFCHLEAFSISSKKDLMLVEMGRWEDLVCV